MPYRIGAKVVFVNTSDEDLTHLFYDINFTKLPEWDSEMSYFHAVWREDKSTKLGVDYTVLPQLSGKGRFLGVSLGIFANKAYETTWWGEGEIKFYIDGDKEFPTLSGTGVEDYIGTAWGRASIPTVIKVVRLQMRTVVGGVCIVSTCRTRFIFVMI